MGPERVLVDRAERNTRLSAVILAVSDKLLCHLINEEAIRQYWEEELAKAGLSLRSDIPGKGVNEGKFAFVRPPRLTPWKPKPKPRPSRPMAPSAEQELRRDRLDKSIGIVAGEARPFGARSVKRESHGLSQSERKFLLEKMYPPYLLIPALAPPTAEGKDGAYLVQDDRRKQTSCEGSDAQAENDVMPERTGSSFFANILPPMLSTAPQARKHLNVD